ncbi:MULTISPECIES: hypothetical protein [Methylomonas]|uniref:hypothetical protein n=1 Tax=Methylomonas TaxID=416 RepID=UPI001231955B|nr:hypothetical protein [Methylomonas rhizoryzae]
MFKPKKALLAGAGALLVGLSVNAYAHTSVLNGTVNADASGEVAAGVNQLIITHSCETVDKNGNETGNYINVIAQSVLFPTGGSDAYITTVEDSTHTPVDVTVENILGESLAGKFRPVSSNEIFAKQSLKQISINNATTTIGFNSYKGRFQQGFIGLVPFHMKKLNIQDTSGTDIKGCTKELQIKVSIADVCKTKGFKKGHVNLWMPNTTDKYTEVVDGTSSTTRGGEPATITVDNSVACPAGKTVVIWPTDSYIDANFAIPKVWN